MRKAKGLFVFRIGSVNMLLISNTINWNFQILRRIKAQNLCRDFNFNDRVRMLERWT